MRRYLNIHEKIFEYTLEDIYRKSWLSLRATCKRLYGLCDDVQIRIQEQTFVFLFIWKLGLCGHGERYYLLFLEIPKEIKVIN